MMHTPTTLRAIALSTLAATAAASCWSQSTVKIYGALDVYVASQQASGTASRKVLNSGFNPNLLGFTGTEDLGGGLQAGFVLESQPVLDTGTVAQGGKFWGRQSLLFLSSSDYGRVSFGRIHTAGRTFAIKYTASGWLSTDPLGNLNLAAGTAMAPLLNVDTVGSRVSNAALYETPRWAGASLSVMQSAAEGGSFASGQAKLTQLGFGYTQGAFTADAVYNRIPALAGSQFAQTDYAIGAQYGFPSVRVMASVFVHKAAALAAPGATTAIAGSEGTDRIVVAGVSVPLGPHTVGASIGRLAVDDAHRGRRPANLSAPFSTPVDDTTAWSLSYAYAFSRRTQFFAAYGSLENGAQGTVSLVGDLRPVAGGRSSMLASGMRHSF